LGRQQDNEPSSCRRIVDNELRTTAVRCVDLEIDPFEDQVDEVIGSDELELNPVPVSRRSSRLRIEIWVARFTEAPAACSSHAIFSHSTGKRNPAVVAGVGSLAEDHSCAVSF
jgi:hypothetical protein